MTTFKQLVRRYTRPLNIEVRRYDPDFTIDTFLWSLLPELAINCIIDVGAHRGEFGKLLRENDYQGEIISFEPVPSSFVHLVRVAADDPKWQTHNLGLSDQDGSMLINVGHLTNYSSFHQPSQYGLETNANGIETMSIVSVPVKRLDSILDELTQHIEQPRVYLKMDTQGWDQTVFSGASDCLANIYGMQSELSMQPLYAGMPSWEEMVQTCREAGYEVSGMFMGFRDQRNQLSEFDCVFVKCK